MVVSLSDADSVVFAVPMVAGLLFSFFRLDELIGRPKNTLKRGRRLTSWDENGIPICEDPGLDQHKIHRQRH